MFSKSFTDNKEEKDTPNHFSLFSQALKQRQRERNLVLSKIMKITTGTMILVTYDGAKAKECQKDIAKVMSQGFDEENAQDKFDQVAKELDQFIFENNKEFISTHCTYEDEGVSKEDLDDCRSALKDKNLHKWLNKLVHDIKHENKLDVQSDKFKQIKALIFEPMKFNDKFESLYKLLDKSPEYKERFNQGLKEYLLPVYALLSAYCKKHEAKLDASMHRPKSP